MVHQIMQGETVERDLLIAATALKRQLISNPDLATAVARWVEVGNGLLLTYIEELPKLSEMDRQPLRALFAELHQTHAGEISEALAQEDFDRLNQAVADTTGAELKDAIERWRRINASRSADTSSDNGRFRVLSVFDEGETTETLIAHDRQLDREVSLTRLRADRVSDEALVKKFRSEAQATARLQHPGILPVYALESDNGDRLSFVTPLIRGEDLATAAAKFHRSVGQHPDAFQSADFRELLRRFIQVCQTIEYAHSQSIVHGCLQASDISLGPHGETLVGGWGGSGPLDENARDRRTQQSPDFRGLAGILFCILTGESVQSSDGGNSTPLSQQKNDLRNPRDLQPNIPSALQAIWKKAASDSSADRYSTIRRLVEDTVRWLADQPIDLQTDPATVQATRWARRHHARAGFLFLGLLSLIGLSFAVTFIGIVTNRQNYLAAEREIRVRATKQSKDDLQIAKGNADLELSKSIARFQTRAGDFHEAVATLKDAAGRLGGRPIFSADANELAIQSNELSSIVSFYEAAAKADTAALEGDLEAQLGQSVDALSRLNIWGNDDPWNNAALSMLTPKTRNRLERDIHRQLMLVADASAKLICLHGPEEGREIRVGLHAGAPLTDERNSEAFFAIEAADAANRFEFSEAVTWTRSLATEHLRGRSFTTVDQLSEPRSAADATQLAEFLMTRIRNKSFPFTGYLGESDELRHAHRLLSFASERAPDDLRTHFLLAAGYFQLGSTSEPVKAVSYYTVAAQLLQRCLAIDPESDVVAAALANVSLREVAAGINLHAADGTPVANQHNESLDRALRLAVRAIDIRRNGTMGWWSYGSALNAAGRVEEALEAWATAVSTEFLFRGRADPSIHSADRFDCRTDAIRELRSDAGTSSLRNALIAATFVNQGEYETSRPFAEKSLQADAPHWMASAVNGFLALHDERNEAAVEYFQKCRNKGTQSQYCGSMGLAVCMERLEKYSDALSPYLDAAECARSVRQNVDALLGQARVLIHMKRSIDAGSSLTKSRSIDPACRLDSVRRLAHELKDGSVIQLLSQFPLQRRLRFRVTSESVVVRNADFELPLGSHWNIAEEPSKPSILVKGKKYETVDSDQKHGRSLSINSNETDVEQSGIEQTVAVEPGGAYRISLSMKTAKKNSGQIRVFLIPAGIANVKPLINETISGESATAQESGWIELKAEFQAPAAKRYPYLLPMKLRIVGSGKVNVTIDNVRIEKSSAAPE